MKSNLKLSRSFKILYVLSCITAIITFFWLIQTFFEVYLNNYLLDALFGGVFYGGILIIHVVVSLLFLIVTFILGVINYKKDLEIKIRKKIKMLLLVITIINLILVLFFPILNLIDNSKLNINENKMVNLAEGLIEKIENSGENKYIYLYDDLKELDNSLAKYDKGSYITYFNNNFEVCLSNGKYRINGNKDNLKIHSIGEIYKSCNYSFNLTLNDDEYIGDGETYLKYYLENKYDINIKQVKIVTGGDILFEKVYIDHYDVVTNAGTFEAMVDVKDNEIVVTDNYNDFINSLNGYDKAILKIEDFTKIYLKNDDIYSNGIGVIRNVNDSYIDIQVEYLEDKAKAYANALADYLLEKSDNINIIIRKLTHKNESCKSLLDCINDVKSEYAISFSINDGTINWN